MVKGFFRVGIVFSAFCALSLSSVRAQASPQQNAAAGAGPGAAANSFAGDGATASNSETAPVASVADLAKAARARKASPQAKSVKTFDEQNMPHAPIAEGQQAPGYSGGRVTLIDFWATWCGPCRESLPDVKKLHAIYGDQVEVISVNEDDNQDDWRAFVSSNGMNWTQKFDEGHQMMQQYGATGLPTYVLVGKDGHVVKSWVGEDESTTLVDRIGEDLKKSIEAKP
jgi:thiol-disulfide isomerase/thioredoxin